MRHVSLVVGWLGVVLVITAFFLPWVHIEVTEPTLLKQVRQALPGESLLGDVTKRLSRVAVEIRRGAELIAGDVPSLSELPHTITGADIPRLANERKTKATMALLELLTRSPQHVGAKSQAVYLLPGLALLSGILLTLAGRRRAVALGIAGACCAIAGVGAWQLSTIQLPHEVVRVTIARGLPLSFAGYALLAASAAAIALLSTRPAPSLR